MTDYHEAFNRTILEFIDDLVNTFPELADFDGFRKITKTCIMIDPETPQKVFHESVTTPYEKYIIARNEAFLLSENYSKSGAHATLIDRIKLIWKGLDDGNKDVIWNYMRALVALDKKCTLAMKST